MQYKIIVFSASLKVHLFVTSFGIASGSFCSSFSGGQVGVGLKKLNIYAFFFTLMLASFNDVKGLEFVFIV